ncbi:MAG: hypothetical protein AB7N76_00465 [Planctomycetota bacterium]
MTLVTSTTYRIDANDRIVWFDEDFRRFAALNDDPDLPERVLHTSLWDHVEGPGVSSATSAVFDRARRAARPLEFPFRCDAPALRRFMRMTVVPLPDDGLELRSTLLRAEPRDPVPIPLGGRGLPGPLVTICAWCRKVQTPRGWLEPEEAIATLDLLSSDVAPGVTHGMCSDCYGRAAAG